MWLRIIALKEYIAPKKLELLLSETDELIKIFNKSVTTVRRNIAADQD